MFQKPSILKPKKIQQRKHFLLGLKILLLILGFVFLVGFISWLTSLRQVTISSISVSGNSAVATEDIEKVTSEQMKGDYFNIFSKANTFLFSKTAILNAVKNSSYWIKDVSLKRKGLTALSIAVTERTPVAAWCDDKSQDDAKCYLMDDSGFVFAKAPDFSGNAYIRFYGNFATSTAIGTQYIDKKDFDQILTMIKFLPSLSLEPSGVEMGDNQEYTISLKTGSRILLDTHDPVDKVISNIQTIMSERQFMDSQKLGFANLEYLDLRFGNKIYYKFKEDKTSTERN
jgi:cell division septal protein FtsQ